MRFYQPDALKVSELTSSMKFYQRSGLNMWALVILLARFVQNLPVQQDPLAPFDKIGKG